MKTKKTRIIIPFIASFLMLGIVGCTNNIPSNPDESGQQQNPDDKKDTIKVTGVSLNKNTIELEKGDSYGLSATVSPIDATNKKVLWSSSNESIVTVDQYGIVNAVESGKAVIVVKTEDGEFTAICNVTIKEKDEGQEGGEGTPTVINVTGVSLKEESKNVYVNDTFTLEYDVLPDNATDKSVTWIFDREYLNKEGDTFTAIKEGKTIVTISTVDGDFHDSCTVNIVTRTVSVTGISLDKDSVALKVGEEVEINATVEPNNATNKNVTWSSDNESVAKYDNGKIVAYSAGNAIITATTVDGGYKDSCAVSVSEVITNVKTYVSDENGLISSIEVKNGDNYASVGELLVENDKSYFSLPLNSEVRVGLKDKDKYVVTGLNINGVAKPIEEGYVEFVVNPGESQTSIEISPVFTIVSEKEYSFTYEPTTHLKTAKIYEDIEKKNEITNANQGETIYIQIESDDADTFCRTLTAKYQTSDVGYYSSKETKSLGDNFFSLEVPYSNYSKVINLVPEEANSELLKGTGLDGKYVVIQVPNYARKINEISAYPNDILNVTLDGNMSLGQNSSRSAVITRVNGDNTVYTSSYSTIPYGKNFIYTSGANSSNTLGAPFSTYDYLCVKLFDTTDETSLYSVTGETFKLDDNITRSVIIVSRDNSIYFTFAIDWTNKTFNSDIDIDLIKGSSVTDNEAVYEVKKDGNILFGVSYNGDGGINNRIKFDRPLGLYRNNENTLLITSSNVAFYNDVKYVCKIENNNVTLTNATTKITISINTINMTFVVDSEETVSKEVPNFKNMEFKGKDNEGDSAEFKFNDYTSLENADIVLTHHWSWQAYVAHFTASYDLDNDIITFTFVSDNYNWNKAGNTLRASVSDKTITFLDELFNLPLKGCSFTCNEFSL